MIEMVYRGTSKDGKGKERTGLPKNIRQIGDAGSDKRVYIEDYVITFLEKTGCAVLLGEVWQNENMQCLFADGASVAARSQYKPDMVGFDLFFFQSAGTDQGCHTDILRMVQPL